MRGTKNPDLAAIRSLSPDVVIANKEENRELDVRRLRDSGVAVWVTDIETVPAAVGSMERLLDGAGLDVAGLARGVARPVVRPVPPVTRASPSRSGATRGWSSARARSPPTCCGGSGGRTSTAKRPTATRRSRLADVDAAGADVVLLPDEPYVFTDDDGPEAFERTPTELVTGRLITWYGPSLVEAARLRG